MFLRQFRTSYCDAPDAQILEGMHSMNVRVLFSTICCFMTVFASTHALAQEIDEVEKQDGDILSIAEI